MRRLSLRDVLGLTYEHVLELHASVMEATASEPQAVLSDSPIRAALERAAWGPFEGDGDLAERAALLLRALAEEHPFVDGNKRTAVADAFVRLNGRWLECSGEALVEFVLSVAKGERVLSEIARWIRDRLAKA